MIKSKYEGRKLIGFEYTDDQGTQKNYEFAESPYEVDLTKSKEENIQAVLTIINEILKQLV